jgi:hypothetical protein
MYRHYLSYQPGHPDYRRMWPTIVADTASIITAVRRAGTVIAGPDGYRRPTLDLLDGVAFNGDATSDLDAGPLLLRPPQQVASEYREQLSCATNRKPYDLAVAASLLRVRLLLPHIVDVASDGAWDREWAIGTAVPRPGLTVSGARQLVADLFDQWPDTNPLDQPPSAKDGPR